MNKKPYKLTLLFLLFGFAISNAQKFEKDFSKEINANKSAISLNANYADIEIIEWDKNKVKIDATMTVEGVSEEQAQSYFDSWNISLTKQDDKIEIISKSKRHLPLFFDESSDFNFETPSIFEMPEISIESLGLLDSMNYSFPEINFSEIFNDSTFNKIYIHDFSNLDSINENFKNNQEYLQEWQEANKENFIKLREKALELAVKTQEVHKKRMKIHQEKMKLQKKKMELNKEKRKVIEKKRTEIAKKRAKKIQKTQKERRNKIKNILKNRDNAKVRTKLIIRVPKKTDFNMNVNYSKISSN